MNSVDDRVTWLRAQLDEDEQVATEAANGYPNWDTTSDGNVVQIGTGGSGYIAAGPWGGDLFEIGVHMARHDPARVLAEIAAKRRLLDWLERAWDAATDNDYFGLDVEEAKRLLALPYADRPGYPPEWRPDA